jgi:hypothetical protein
MEDRRLDLGAALTTSFEAIKRYPALAIGGFVIYFAAIALIQLIPLLNVVTSILLMPALAGGFIIFSLNLVDDNDPKIEDLVAGFQAYGKWMGVYWLFALIKIAAYLPAGIALLPIILVRYVHLSFALSEGVGAACGIAAASLIVGAIAFLIRYAFVYYVAVETPGIWDSFRGSEMLTQGRRLQIVWMAIVLGLVAVSGVIAVVVGILFTCPLASYAMAALYRQLNPRRQWQAEVAPPVEAPPFQAGEPQA